MKLLSTLAALAAFTLLPVFGDDAPPKTLMTKPGKLILSEDFSKPLPPVEGSTARFASGFHAWRFNVEQRGGHWDVVEGTFRGVENPESKHPATASYGFDFKNAVIQCEIRMHDVPLNGRTRRAFSVRTTDAKDYVCSIILDETGMKIQKDDNDHAGPDRAEPFGFFKSPLKLGEWQTVVFEVYGDEMVGTLNGHSLTGKHPLITSDKHSIMFVSNGEGAVRNLKIWEAEPNPDWAKNRTMLPAQLPPPPPAPATTAPAAPATPAAAEPKK